MKPKFKIGQTFYYMYLNWICKSKVETYHEKDGQIYYTDKFNNAILEKYSFKNKSELFDFQNRRKNK